MVLAVSRQSEKSSLLQVKRRRASTFNPSGRVMSWS